MKIGILGTGVVGRTLGTKLVEGGHEVLLGSRTANNEAAAEWVASVGAGGRQGTFAEAADFGEVVLNCTAGEHSLAALKLAGAERLAGKVLIDIANPLDFSRGMPPSLTVCNEDSLGEQIQRALPGTHVVKTLNTVNCSVMVDPGSVPGDHVVFLSGDRADAKGRVKAWLGTWFGWRPEQVVDLGDMTSARGAEMMLPVWLRLWSVLGTPTFNWQLQVGDRG